MDNKENMTAEEKVKLLLEKYNDEAVLDAMHQLGNDYSTTITFENLAVYADDIINFIENRPSETYREIHK